MAKKNTKKGQKGFSLIELLIVIAIIGILMSIVLSSLNSARAKAKISSWKSSVSSSLPEVVSCCSDGKSINNSGVICNGGSSWPETQHIGNITINNGCDLLNDSFRYTISGPDSDVSNSCKPAVCDKSGCIFEPVDADHKC